MKTKFPSRQSAPFSVKETEKKSDPTSFKQRYVHPQVYNLPAMYIKERLSAVSVNWRRHFFSRGMVRTDAKQEEGSPDLPIDYLSINRAKLVTEAISYRTPLPVTHIRKLSDDDFYPVCPRCKISLEREYMAYCDRCGQCLNWDIFDKAQWCISGNSAH